jgi:hypothetical protein
MNGQIRDQITGKPIAAVAIYESSQTGQQIGTRGTTSDADGRFVTTWNTGFVTFKHISYKPITISNREGFVIIDLLPAAYDLPGGDIVATKKMPWWVYLLAAAGLYQIVKK